jgi:hypothetical protein
VPDSLRSWVWLRSVAASTGYPGQQFGGRGRTDLNK